LNRVWRLVERIADKGELERANERHEAEVLQVKRKTHLTIKKVTEDIDGAFHFNTALSAIMELVNEIYIAMKPGTSLSAEALAKAENQKPEMREAIEAVVILLAPFVPHIAEEMWERLGKSGSVFNSKWPKYEPEALSQDNIIMVVQINGKVRARVEVSSDISEEEIKRLILDDPVVDKWIEKKPIKKFIIVRGRLVNLVI